VPRDPYPQHARSAGEDERRVHRQRLAVDRDLDRPAGPDLEARRLPFQPAGEPPHLPEALQGDELARLRGAVDPCRHHAEQAVVQPLACAAARHLVELVPVVRHEDEVRGAVPRPVRPGEAQVKRCGVRA
jgi:hypothetical protein